MLRQTLNLAIRARRRSCESEKGGRGERKIGAWRRGSGVIKVSGVEGRPALEVAHDTSSSAGPLAMSFIGWKLALTKRDGDLGPR